MFLDTTQEQLKTPGWIPGLELARLYYQEAIAPILQKEFPGLVYSAALIGTGSEVLGFDTEMSSDHNWGPRCYLFLTPEDQPQSAAQIHNILAHQLPFEVAGYPTHFEAYESENGTVLPKLINTRPINHRVQIVTLPTFLRDYIGTELQGEVTLADWLTIPEQKLRTLTAGAVFHDGLNILEPLRQKLAYYPHDLWIYLLSAQWQRIGQEEPFVGRTGLVGDEIGSAVIAARLVRDLMRLCFLMEKQYAPYSKWFGTAFSHLQYAGSLSPLLQQVLQATNWQDRQTALAAIYEILATMHNHLGLTQPITTNVSYFFDRPFFVIWGSGIAEKIFATIQDEAVKALPFGVGKVDQFVDSTDILSESGRYRALAPLYGNPVEIGD